MKYVALEFEIHVDWKRKYKSFVIDFLSKVPQSAISLSNPCILPLPVHVGNATGCHAGCQKVSICRTRGESEESITHRKEAHERGIHPGFEI